MACTSKAFECQKHFPGTMMECMRQSILSQCEWNLKSLEKNIAVITIIVIVFPDSMIKLHIIEVSVGVGDRVSFEC